MCEVGWGYKEDYKCNKCPPTQLNSLYFALAFLITVGTVAVAVKANLTALTAKPMKIKPGAKPAAPKAPPKEKPAAKAAPKTGGWQEELTAMSSGVVAYLYQVLCCRSMAGWFTLMCLNQ